MQGYNYASSMKAFHRFAYFNPFFKIEVFFFSKIMCVSNISKSICSLQLYIPITNVRVWLNTNEIKN